MPRIPAEPKAINSSERRSTSPDAELLFSRGSADVPLTAVRSVLIQSSMTKLDALGHLNRYRQLIDPAKLAELTSLIISPTWIPVDLALAHYQTCDALMLDTEQLEEIGAQVGDRLQNTLLISFAKKGGHAGRSASMEVLGPFFRMGARIFQGGLAEFFKLGPADMGIDHTSNPLFQFHYFRTAYSATVRTDLMALGLRITQVKFLSYDEHAIKARFRACWE